MSGTVRILSYFGVVNSPLYSEVLDRQLSTTQIDRCPVQAADLPSAQTGIAGEQHERESS